ncbi:MAG: ABC transporter substrate-binding protein [Leeuwenhoekiella sp.]
MTPTFRLLKTKTINQFFCARRKNVIPVFIVFIFVLIIVSGCKQSEKTSKNAISEAKKVAIDYAEGFSITDYGDYKILSITEAFPGSDEVYTYALVKEGKSAPDSLKPDATVQIPVKKIVVTSTTHIPSLEMLGVENTLVGFPNLDYISSSKTRDRITQGKVEELGQNESINTETTINLSPDAVVSFGVEGQNKALNSLDRAHIPVLYNGDWVEHSPLGKAEWIKFFGALYDKQDMADSIFNVIATRYKEAKNLALKAKEKPTVLSGAMFKDVWYLPHGDSWAAQLIADANADYLYKNSEGTGSLASSLEEVLDTGQKADFWISPNAFESYTDLKNASAVYTQFKAFEQKQIYGFASAKGETGGLIYYELAPNHPDWVLQDLVHIFHPALLPKYEPHFFKPLAD